LIDEVSRTFIRLSARVLLGLEQLLVNKHLVILPHDLALQDLPIFDQPFKLFDHEDGLGRDASVANEGDDGIGVPDQLKEYWLDGRVVTARQVSLVRCRIVVLNRINDLHEEDHVEFRRIPDGQALHHLLSSLLFFSFDMRRFTDHDPDHRQGINVRPSERIT
jgi:hypothetical protein